MSRIARRILLKVMASSIVAPPIAMLGWPVRAQVAPSPRQKLENFVSQPTRLAALKRGVNAMKARKPSDPTSWFFQSAIHAVTSEAIQDALHGDPNVAQVDKQRFWNQCPHFGQSSAEFLLWHRAYLYYFERILRQASGDPTLSLPYWNYTEPTQRRFPTAFGDPEADPVTQKPKNPLFDQRREQALMSGLYELSEAAVGTTSLFQVTDFFGATEGDGFAGGVADSKAGTKGRIERQPHDLMHFAIGGAIGTGTPANPGDDAIGIMTDVATAAFDPVFWVHHANIDRLWTQWECLTAPERAWGMVPPKDWLDGTPWSFNDAGGQVVTEPRRFYLDRQNLPVSYDSDQAQCKPLSAKPFPTPATPGNVGPSPLSVDPAILSFVLKTEAGSRPGTGRVTPDASYTVTIPLMPLSNASGGNAKNSIMSATKSAPSRVVLEIGELQLEGVTSVGFDVYVNLPEGAVGNRQSSAYVGTVSLFGTARKGAHGHEAHASSTQRFDISRAVVADTFDASQARITIIPFDLLTPAAGQPRLRRPVGLSHGPVRILILEGTSNPIM